MVKKVEKTITEKVEILSPQYNFRSHKSESVKEVVCVNVFEMVPGKLRGHFMDELCRILVVGGKARFTVQYWNTWRSIYDYRYEWPPVCEQSFLMFNKAWREVNKPDLVLASDFDFEYGYAYEVETAARNDESKAFYVKHYTNCVDALQLTLTKR